MAYKIQHLGLGGVFDQAIAVVKDHFGLFARILLTMSIPFNLVTEYLAYASTAQFQQASTDEEFERARETQSQFALPIMLLNLLSFFFVSPATNGAVIHAVAYSYLGNSITAMEAMRYGLRRFGPLILTTILMYISIWLGFLLLIIPGIYIAIWFGLSQEVVVIEGTSGPKALGRSRKLVHPYRGKFLALGIVLFVATLLLTLAAESIPQPHVRIIASTLIQAGTTVLLTAALVVFYFSCRCGLENFDLQYLAEAIAAEPIEESAADVPTA